MKQVFCLLGLVVFLMGCSSNSVPSKSSEKRKAPKGKNVGTQEFKGLQYINDWKSPKDAVTFMTFNVENLFDTEDDPTKNDETFLPKELKQSKAHKAKCAPIPNKRWKRQCLDWDWSEDLLKFKLEVLSKSILQAKGGKGPDILVLQEVENLPVLERLNKKGLNYPTVVLVEGKDKRGIDVAILSRLEVRGMPVLHQIPFVGFSKKRVDDTRGILQVDLEMPNKEVVTVLGVHFPAPFHPAEMRRQAYGKLNTILDGLPKGRLVMSAGDFNVPKREDEKMNLVSSSTDDHWVVGHKVACQSCPGSTYYPPKDSWSFLDMILWSKDHSKSSWKIVKDSMRVLNQGPGQMAKSGAPARFEFDGPTGVSDHWPLAIDLVPAK